MNDIINLLQRRNIVWRGSLQQDISKAQASEYSELDDKLAGGFPEHGVVDISAPQGIGEIRLLLPLLKKQRGLLVFINPPGHLCAEQLHHYGLDISQVLLVFCGKANDALWAAECCLKSGACGTVLIWQNVLEIHHVKRLQVASETGGCLLFLQRSRQQDSVSLPVTLGLSLSANDLGIDINIRKRKGGWPLSTFSVDMRQQWPALTINRSTNVLHFPVSKVI